MPNLRAQSLPRWFDCWGAKRQLSRCLLQHNPCLESGKLDFSQARLKQNWLLLRLLTDADNVCSAVNICLRKGELAEGISFGWAAWNLFKLTKKHNTVLLLCASLASFITVCWLLRTFMKNYFCFRHSSFWSQPTTFLFNCWFGTKILFVVFVFIVLLRTAFTL